MRAQLVVEPGARPFEFTLGEKVDQLSSARTGILLPEPASFIRIDFSLIGASSNSKRAYVVFNAISDADAAVKLAAVGQRYVLPIGRFREWSFSESGLLNRVDILSDGATETANSTLITWEAGVL